MEALSNTTTQKTIMGTKVAIDSVSPIMAGFAKKSAYGSEAQTEIEKGRALNLNYLQRANAHRRQAVDILQNVASAMSSQVAYLGMRGISGSSGSARALIMRDMNMASRDFSTSINNIKISKANANVALIDAQRRAQDLQSAGTKAMFGGLLGGLGAAAGGAMELQQSGFFKTTPSYQPLYNFHPHKNLPLVTSDPYTSIYGPFHGGML